MQDKSQAFGLFTLQGNKLVEMLIYKQEIEGRSFFFPYTKKLGTTELTTL